MGWLSNSQDRVCDTGPVRAGVTFKSVTEEETYAIALTSPSTLTCLSALTRASGNVRQQVGSQRSSFLGQIPW